MTQNVPYLDILYYPQQTSHIMDNCSMLLPWQQMLFALGEYD